MNTSTQRNWTVVACLFFILTVSFTCCRKGAIPIYSPPPGPAQEAMFFLAKLAESTSGTVILSPDSIKGVQELTALGNNKISGAISNDTLIKAFGNYGTAPVWGPAVKTSFLGDTASLTDNLLYAVKSEQKGKITYTIGVSGTNPISYFGWFDEDFKVDRVVPWKDPKGQEHGFIARGSKLGLDILLNLRDQRNTGILDFIKRELENGKASTTYTIAVTGHSLGGTLSPLLALYLKEQLSAAKLKVPYTVEAWPYAGATPGGKDFAAYLVKTLDAYHAFNNDYDVVPHAWDLESLDRLCDIYVTQEDTCIFGKHPIEAGTIISGVAQWAIGESKASGIQYQIAGTPNTFIGRPFPADIGLCDTLIFAPHVIRKRFPSMYDVLEKIHERCSDVNDRNFHHNIRYFILYFLDLNFQHTVAYELRYFRSEELRATVNNYLGGHAVKHNLPYVEPILSGLLTAIDAYLVNNNVTDCNCPN